MSISSTAGYLARRAAQKERVRILYRRALKDTLNWAVHRHLFYRDVYHFSFPSISFWDFFDPKLIWSFLSNRALIQASDLRERFEANKNVVRSLFVPSIFVFFYRFFFCLFFALFCIAIYFELVDLGELWSNLLALSFLTSIWRLNCFMILDGTLKCGLYW